MHRRREGRVRLGELCIGVRGEGKGRERKGKRDKTRRWLRI